MSKVQMNMALINSTKCGKESEAISHMNRAVRLDPYLALAFFERANIHFKIGDYSCSLLDLNTAFKVFYRSFPPLSWHIC